MRKILFGFCRSMGQIRDEVLLQKIGKRLATLREKAGLSQQQVYHETEIHIARIELGKVNISVSTLSALCEYYGITLAEFFKKMK